MFKKILVATDGSAEALAATEVAAQYAECKLVEEEVILLNTAQNFVQGSVELVIQPGVIEGWDEAAKEYADKILAEAIAKFKNSNIKVTAKFIEGDPASIICKYAEKNGCDLIIMGSRGNGQLKGLLLGSVSTKVLHYATCPVLIVRC